MENRYYGLPDDILMIILLLVRDALHEELLINRNALWFYKGRIAFVAAREATSEYDSDSDSEHDSEPDSDSDSDFEYDWKQYIL
jgi:hypothetical protein